MEEIENFVFHSYCCQEERYIKALVKTGGSIKNMVSQPLSTHL